MLVRPWAGEKPEHERSTYPPEVKIACDASTLKVSCGEQWQIANQYGRVLGTVFWAEQQSTTGSMISVVTS